MKTITTSDFVKTIYYWNNDVTRLQYQDWLVGGRYHRMHGPARIWHRHDGSLQREEWYENGKMHRTDGPAIIEYAYTINEDDFARWFFNGMFISEHDDIDLWIRDNNLTTPFTDEDLIAIKLRWC